MNPPNLNLSPASRLLRLRSPAMDLKIMRCPVILAMVLQNLLRRSINLILIKLTLEHHHLIRLRFMDSRVELTLLGRAISHSSRVIRNNKDISNSSMDFSQNSKGFRLHNLDISRKDISQN